MTRTLIHNGAICTPQGWISHGYVLIDGQQISLVSAGSPPADLAWDKKIDASGQAILPGLENAHTHLSQTFMRGLAGGRPLIRWLKERIWPIQALMTPELLHLAALLGLVENLRCGNTHVVNHHKVAATPQHNQAVLDACLQVGLKVSLARAWVDKGANAEAPQSILDDLQWLYDHWHGANDGRIQVASGPLATWRCSVDTLLKTRQLSRQYHSFTHIHVAETRDEVQMSLDEYGVPPVTWLDEIGVLGEDTHVVHAVWVNKSEIKLLAHSRARVVHCPVSNAVLGSGTAPLTDLIQAGANLRLGTDGSASNDSQDLWETIKTALMLSRVRTLDPTQPTPRAALELALSTPGIRVGEPADLILVRVDHVRAAPVYDLDSALSLCTHGSDVETVIVGGQVLMQDHKVLVVDEASLVKECQQAIQTLQKAL
ncbi:MAG: amidohydrolase [Chloroflexi bacterium]|nr:amidohydrolase [Anaerolineaceae bacterium]NMB87634.1 amidohydrolase [Chloroflexota bacterium]